MGKILKSILATVCMGVVALSAVGCKESISAYEIAVKNGFQGTEAEWLLSLRGADGDNGADLDADALYKTAVDNGYEGSFIDFCETLQITVPQNNDVKTIAKNIRSVVSIYCSYSVTTAGNGWLGNYGSKTTYKSQAGSGVITYLNKEAGNALIITNYHVVYNLDSDQKGILDDIWVYPYGAYNAFTAEQGDSNGDGIKATYLGGAMDYDIAILKIEGSEYLKNSVAMEADIGDSETVRLGEEAFVVGNPAGAGIAVTNGIVSVDSEYISIAALDERDEDKNGAVDGVTYRVMRTSAAINGGNSGGGLFNAKGELIGIVNAKSAGTTTDNMGYALPITLVMGVYKNILENGGTAKQAMLGVIVYTKGSRAELDSDGLLSIVEEFVVKETATEGASSYKKFNVGDLFISASVNGGEEIVFTRRHHLTDVLLSVRKGDTVRFTMLNASGERETKEIRFDKDSYFKEYK